MLYLFDGGQLAPEDLSHVVLQPEELSSLEFVARADIAQRTISRLARRIEAAMDARDRGAPVYLEHGQAPDAAA